MPRKCPCESKITGRKSCSDCLSLASGFTDAQGRDYMVYPDGRADRI